MKILTLCLLTIAFGSTHAFGQNSSVDVPVAGVASSDNFSYSGKTVSHYGLGWYNESSNVPPMAYLSAYWGIKLFTNGTPRMFLDNAGNVGIGTNSPSQKFNISGLSVQSAFSQTNISAYANNGMRITGVFTTDGITQDAITYQSASGGGGAAIAFGRGSSWDTYMSFYTNSISNTATGGISEKMRIDNAGNVGIGTTDPKGYRLAVNGDMIATSVKVKLYNAWPDYVFKPNYKLTPLSEVKTYIDKNQHLPEMPSAAQVEKDGLNLGEMNRLLLKKVEELTLYLIEKDKQFNDLKAENKKENEALKAKIESLAKEIQQK